MKNGISVLISFCDQDDVSLFENALISIWDGQSLKPNEIILVVDGPVNSSATEVFDKWQLRLGLSLVLIKLKKNVGLAQALNEGLKTCNFAYTARMDSDDKSLYRRFELQKEFLDRNHDVAVVGGFVKEIDVHDESRNTIRTVPLTNEEIREFAAHRNPLSHPTVMMRTKVIQILGGYPELRKCQDYALWAKLMSDGYKIQNIDKVIVEMTAGLAMIERRGLKFWFHEIRVFWYLNSIGFISPMVFLINVFARFLVRVPPAPIRRALYRLSRNEVFSRMVR